MSKLVVYLSAIVVACLVVAEPAFAGPGGKIASVLSETFWGKVIIICLLVFFSPFIYPLNLKMQVSKSENYP